MNNNVKHKGIRDMLVSLLIVLILLGADQATKCWAYSDLRVNGPITLIKGILSFTYTFNEGAAWGMLSGSVILDWLPVIISLLILVAYQRVPATKRMLPLNTVMLLIFSGAVGNRIDRAVYGSVQDFIYFELIDFPIFNVADCYIVIGSILAIILFIFYYKEEDEFEGMFTFKKNKKEQGN